MKGLSVTLVQEGDWQIISVQDDGKGRPTDFSLASAESLEMTFVTSLAQQLGGTLSLAGEAGLNSESDSLGEKKRIIDIEACRFD